MFATELFNALARTEGGVAKVTLVVTSGKLDDCRCVLGSSFSSFGPNRIQIYFVSHFDFLFDGWFNGRFGFERSRATTHAN